MDKENQKSGKVNVRIIRAPIAKSDKPEHLSKEEGYNSAEWINPPMDLYGLREMVKGSTILPQCINAYKRNIAGFGLQVRYIEDYDDETEEMAAEFEKLEGILQLLNFDADVKEVFENMIVSRETYGIGYAEVIRDVAGNVVQIEHIADTPSIMMTQPQHEYVEVPYFYKGTPITRKKRFRRYKQQVGGKTVYFKEFGDPRIMDKRSGEYLKDGEKLELNLQANEILEIKNGTEHYGEVRWEGQILTIDGCRSAEKLNNNYFRKGRHTPMAILINGGTLSDASYEKLQEYMNEIEGENGQHSFLLLESENVDPMPNLTEDQKPRIEIKDLASILQKDELFQEYLNNGRKKAQSAFLLPDLYVGYTTDFNRSTAQTAMEVTEKQVFQPERKSLAWIINHKLLNGYGFRYCEVEFKKPDITNPDDIAKILQITSAAGGLTMNDAHDYTCQTLGKQAEDYPEEFGQYPFKYLELQGKQQQTAMIDPQIQITPAVMGQLEEKIEKAANAKQDDIVAVLKEIRKALRDYSGKE